jgi:hypothetical protein
MGIEDFERARSSVGTDDDILELPLPLKADAEVAQRWAARERELPPRPTRTSFRRARDDGRGAEAGAVGDA